MEMLQGWLSVEKDDVRRCRLWSCRGAFEGAKGQSRNHTKRLCLSASRDAGTPWCWDGAVHGGAARAAERRKKSVVSGAAAEPLRAPKVSLETTQKDCA